MKWTNPMILGLLAGSGKFKVKWVTKTFTYDICGITFGSLLLRSDVGQLPVKAEECTLIARPLSSMTDEEESEIQDLNSVTYFYKKDISEVFKTDGIEVNEFLYLISIGILDESMGIDCEGVVYQ